MKAIVIFILSVLVFCSSFGQELNPELQKEILINRSHHQQRTGWILIGIGAATTTLGVVAYYCEKNSKPDLLDFTGEFTAIVVGGSVMAVSGIVYLISSRVNKRKAQQIELSINSQSYINTEFHQLALKPQPVIKIAFKF